MKCDIYKFPFFSLRLYQAKEEHYSSDSLIVCLFVTFSSSIFETVTHSKFTRLAIETFSPEICSFQSRKVTREPSRFSSSYLQGWKIETIKGQIDAQTFAFKASVSQAKMYLYFQSVSNCTVCSFQVPPPHTHKYLYWINAINAQMSIKRTNKQTKSRLRIILINDSPLQHVYRAQLL